MPEVVIRTELQREDCRSVGSALALLQYFQHQQETNVDIILMAASLQYNFIFVFLMLLFKVLDFKI